MWLPAARMPQVPGDVIRDRAARLRAAGDAAMKNFMTSRIGQMTDVLIERDGEGLCARYLPVRLEAGGVVPEAGRIVPVIITGLDGDTLTARPVTGDSSSTVSASHRGQDEHHQHSA